MLRLCGKFIGASKPLGIEADMIDIATIENMRERGLSYGQISNALGININTVQYYCYEHGIYGPNDFARGSKKYPPEIDALIMRLRINGESVSHIARIVGRPRTSVRSRLRTLARHEEMRLAA
jgi:DNA-directed RNA polymerase specialized sigma24 family protein